VVQYWQYFGRENMNNKFIKLFRILFTSCVSLLLQSCVQNDDSYFPLTEGYQWRYDVTQSTQDGTVKQKYLYRNIGESKLNETIVYLRRSFDGTELYYSDSDEGVIYHGSKNYKGIEPEFIREKNFVFRYPISENKQWDELTKTKLLFKSGTSRKTVFRLDAEVPLKVKIESLNEEVQVSAGLFKNCMKISMSGSVFKDAGKHYGLTLVSIEQTSWYAKGVGLIKMERSEETKNEALGKGSLLVELEIFKKN
jgi:hypothetical protein